MKRDKIKTVLILIAAAVMIVTVFHHFLVSGKIIDIADILHHETVLIAALFFIVGFVINEFVNLYIEP